MLRVHNADARDLSCWRLAAMDGACCSPTRTWTSCFSLATKKPKPNFGRLIAEFSRTMWDLGFRVSSAGRTIDECKRIEEDNAEFHLALLDRRFLAGDEALFDKLDQESVAGL